MFYRLQNLRKLALVATLGLAACASQVTRHEAPTEKLEPVRALASFSVTVSPKAKMQLGETLRFDAETLRANLQKALEARNLIATDGDFTMQVVVEDVRVRSTFNAVMWGFMAGDDHLNGTAAILRRDGTTAGSFAVNTSYALGGIAGGVHATRMGWLYEEFSKKLTDELVARRDAKP